MRRRRAALLAVASAAIALGACRAVIGIEELGLADADAGRDASADVASEAEATAGDAAADGALDVAAVLAKCRARGESGCAACCASELEGAFDTFLAGDQVGCACGGPGAPDAACGPDCGGNEAVCPGSPKPPAGGPPQDCRGCVLRNAAAPPCARALTACKSAASCEPVARCFEQCPR